MKKLIATAALALIITPVFAITGFLQSESVNGGLKYCKYSNGVIITINSYELCPLSVS